MENIEYELQEIKDEKKQNKYPHLSLETIDVLEDNGL
jgi:hypothetical protein